VSQSSLLELIKSIPYFARYSEKLLDTVKFTLIPSNTNNTYKVLFKDHTNEAYILKTPKSITNNYVNRDNEKHNSNIAFNLALTAEPLWFGDTPLQQGVSCSRYITNCRTLIPSDLKHPVTLNQIAEALKELQSSQDVFMGDLSDTSIIQEYLSLYYKQCSSERQDKLSNNYIKAQQALDQICLENLPINIPVPAHNDLMADNILIQELDDSKIWLIDWEYSAMASPYWDIATLCNVANFNQNEAKAFLCLVLDDCNEDDGDKAIINLANYRIIVRSLVECWRGAFVK
jgi:thiamine kinase-like enzyme